MLADYWCWGDLISDDVANKILKKALDQELIFLIRQTLMGMVEVKYFYQISLNQPKKKFLLQLNWEEELEEQTTLKDININQWKNLWIDLLKI